MRVSTLILTLNEERNLQHCISSLSWCDDIVVLDSFSTDSTEQIAKSAQVRFYQRSFDDYAAQRNYGLTEIQYKHPWVLMVDADEMVSPSLANEISQKTSAGKEDITLYHMRRKDYFQGKWIKYSSGYPTWFGRLIRLGKVFVQRPINEEYHTQGQKGYLKAHLHHYPFNNGLNRWVEKHNRYSKMEAELITSSKRNKYKWKDMISKDPVVRRQTTKSIVYRIPGRPLLIFCALYILRGGFRDGKAGLNYCLLKAFYEFLISCKVQEIKFEKSR